MGKASSILATAQKKFLRNFQKSLDKPQKVWYNKYNKLKKEVKIMMLVKSICVVLMVAIGLAYIGLVVGCEIKGGR